MEENVTNKNNKISTIILIIVAIAAIALGGFICFQKVNEGKDVKTEEKQEKTEVNDKKYDEEVKIDASLATQPLTDAYIDGLSNFNIKAEYTNTDPAYTKLINKEVDLIVVTEPSKEEKERAQKANVELEVTPVVNEGFVFYTNKKNSVSSLKLEEIQKIYSGEITNWKQVGGQDAKIIAYQRPTNSGSQTGILSLVMKGKKMKEPKKDELVESMAGIIDVVSNYKSGADSIGYSYYYYANVMYSNENLKFLAINGVEPNHDTIKNGKYPLLTSYYIVTLKNNDKEVVKKLKEEMLGKRGQEIARKAGYVELG